MSKSAPEKKRAVAYHYQLEIRVVENIEAIEIGRSAAGYFVMLTNVPGDGEQGYNSGKILRTYRRRA